MNAWQAHRQHVARQLGWVAVALLLLAGLGLVVAARTTVPLSSAATAAPSDTTPPAPGSVDPNDAAADVPPPPRFDVPGAVRALVRTNPMLDRSVAGSTTAPVPLEDGGGQAPVPVGGGGGSEPARSGARLPPDLPAAIRANGGLHRH